LKIRKHPLAVLLASISVAAVGTVNSTEASAADPTLQCVVVNVDTCTVTIPLTSNMNEQVRSTMPDANPWFMSESNGQGPYAITGPGNPQTTWNGVSGALQGTAWSAVLTTGSGEPAGSQAVLTFAHVKGSTTTTSVAQPYASISSAYPLGVARGSMATITATVRPVPAKGHLILWRKSGSSWAAIGPFTYSSTLKKWSIRFVWQFPKRAVETFRLLATAAPGLTSTYGGTFKISTLG